MDWFCVALDAPSAAAFEGRGGENMIGWRDGEGGLHRDTLFDVFAALARGDAWSFPALRPHQREPWHAFTVQVAAMALIRAGLDELPREEAAWRDLLLALTPDHPDGEAWSLVVDDWTKPALLQPPVVVDANRADYKSRLATPDALDMLVTAKNHDVKQERFGSADEEDWLFALVTLQTTEGYLGAGNFGISRMNGGFATRMSLGVRPSGGGASGPFRRDVRRLVADARSRPDRRTGTELLWTVPWDGTRSLDYTELDELYVEICRRVRLRDGATGIEALAAGSKCARVAAADLKGKTRDPWAPIKADDSASHTPTGAGFGYRQMTNLLDRKKVSLPLLSRLHSDDDRQGMAIVATALVRGQGKTEGLHRREVRTTWAKESEAFGEVEIFDKMGDVAMRRMQEVSDVSRILTRALSQVMQSGPKNENVRGDDKSTKAKVEPWLNSFDDVVDEQFFSKQFWIEVGKYPLGRDGSWHSYLVDAASSFFEEAVKSGPRTEVLRLRAWARGRNYLDSKLKTWMEAAGYGNAG